MSATYSREQLEKMQREAEKRVMEMRQRSKAAAESPRKENKAPDLHSAPPSSHTPRFLELLNVKKMLADPDDRLVLLLIALLSGEGADPMLLFALMYIII